MEQYRAPQSRTRSIAVGMLCMALAVPSMVRGDAYDVDGVGPSEDIIQGAPSVSGFVNDGDETVVETVLLYMNGCPLVSITPPDGGRGMPVVTTIEQTGDCVAGRGTGTATVLEARGDTGMHVQLWTDAENDDPASLVIEVSSLYPDVVETAVGAIAPLFAIPGVFGDPSGDLTLASGGGGAGGSIWGGGANAPGWPGGAPGGVGGGGGGGGNIPGGSFLNTTPGVSAPPAPPIAAVPLPATLLLLLWALQLLRSYVRRT